MVRFLLALLLVSVLFETAFGKSFVPKAFSGKFIQERVKQTSKNRRVSKDKITMKYQYPGNIHLVKSGDPHTVYVCNRKNVWIYTPPFLTGEAGDLSIGSTSKYCFSKLFDILKKGLKTNEKYTVTKLTSKSYELEFIGSAKSSLGISKAKINLNSSKTKFSNIADITIYHTGGAHPVVLRVQSLKKVKNFSKSIFKFKAPKNTNVTRI